MEQSYLVVDRTDRVLRELEDAEIERMNQALDRSYSDLERELLRTYPNYTAESQPNLLATQRAVLLTQELSQQLILINPEREAEITARYERLLSTANKEGITLSDELMRLKQGDDFVKATATVPAEAVAASARDAVGRLKKHDQAFREEAIYIIQQGLIQGWGPQRTTRELRDRLGIAKGKAETIARTEIISAQDTATRANYQRNGVSLVVRISTEDSRTCFPAGTLIRTDNGDRPIEAIREGDMVLTRQGFRRVAKTMSRDYSGSFTRIDTGSLSVVATSDHPFWTADGWREAQELSNGDTVQTFDERLIQVSSTKNLSLRETQNRPSVLREIGVLPGISLGVLMPKCTVGFNSNFDRRESKINGIAPELIFLDEVQSKAFHSFSNSLLKARFSGVFAVARDGAESLLSHPAWNDPERLAASQAFNFVCRTTALFRAVFSKYASKLIRRLAPELLPASLTRIETPFGCALTTASFVPVLDTDRDGKFFVAGWTDLGNHFSLVGSEITRPLAILLRLSSKVPKFASAVGAIGCNSFPLSNSHALARAKLGIPFTLKPVAANLAGLFHKSWVANLSIYSNLFSVSEKVYNLTIEDVSEYYANGILVHNCGYCAARAGKVYEVDKAPAAIHPRDRCFNSPYFGDEDPEDTEWIKRHAKNVQGYVDKVNDGPAPFERLAGVSAPKAIWTPQRGWVDRDAQRRLEQAAIAFYLASLLRQPAEQEPPRTPEEEHQNNILKALAIGAAITGVSLGAYYLARSRYRAGFAESARMAEAMAGEFAAIADMDIPDTDQITLAIGGFNNKAGQAGLEQAPEYQKFLENHTVVGVTNPNFETQYDTGTEPVQKVSEILGKSAQYYLVEARNPDAVRMAAAAIAFHKKHGRYPNLIGYSGGGLVVREAHEILKAYGAKGVKSISVASPWLGFEDLSSSEHIDLLNDKDLFANLPQLNGVKIKAHREFDSAVAAHEIREGYLPNENFKKVVQDFFGTDPLTSNKQRQGEIIKADGSDIVLEEIVDGVFVDLYPELRELTDAQIAELPESVRLPLLRAKKERAQLPAAPERIELPGYKELLALPEGKQAIALLQSSTNPRIRALLNGSPELLSLPAGAELPILPGYEELLMLPEGKRIFGLLAAAVDPKLLEGKPDLLALPEARKVFGLLAGVPDMTALPAAPKLRALQAAPEFLALTGRPELKALKASPVFKALTASPAYKALTGSPDLKALAPAPELPMLLASPELKMLPGVPEFKALQASPEFKALQASPEFKALAAAPEFKLLEGKPEFLALQGAPELKALPPVYKQLLALPPSDRPAFLASGKLPYYALPEDLRKQLEQQVRLMTPVERQAVQTRTQQQLYKLARQQEREAARAATFRLQGELKQIAQTDLPPGQKLDQYRSIIFGEVSKLGVTETVTPPGAPKPEEMLRFELGGVTWYVPATVKQGSPQIDLIRRFVEIAPPQELLSGTREIYLSRQTSTSETYWRKKMKMLGAQVPAASTFESGAITFYRGKAKADEMLRQMGYQKAYQLYGQLEPPEQTLFRNAMQEGRPSTAYALSSPAHDFADSIKEFLLDPEHLQRFAPRRFEALQQILRYTPTYTPKPRKPDTKSAQVIEQVRTKTSTLLDNLKTAQDTVTGLAQKQRSTKAVQSALDIDTAPLQVEAERASVSIRAQEQSINRLQGTVNYLEQRRAQLLNPFNKPYFTDVPGQIRQAKALLTTVERDLRSLSGIRKQLSNTRAQIAKVNQTIENLSNQKQTTKPNEQAALVNQALNDTIDLVNDAESELIGLPRSPERSQALRDIQRIRATVVSQSNVPTIGELHRRELTPLLSSLQQVSDRLEGVQQRIEQAETAAQALKQRLNRLPTKTADLPRSQAEQYAAIKRTRAAQSKLPAKVDRYRQIREQYTSTLAEQQAKVSQLNDNYEEQRNSTQNNMAASIDRKLGQMRNSLTTLATLPRGSVQFLLSRRDWEYLDDPGALPEDAALLVQGQEGKTLQEKLEAAQKFVALELGKVKVSLDAIRKDLEYAQNFSAAQLAELDKITQDWESISNAIQNESGTITEQTQKKKAANPESIKPEDVVKSGNQILSELDQYNEEFVQILLREESVDPKAIIDQSELYRRAREAFNEETLKTQEYLLGEIQDGLTTANLLKRRIERDTQEQLRLQVDGKSLTPEQIEELLTEADNLIKQYLTIPQISTVVEETESELLRQAENRAKADRVSRLRDQINGLQSQLGALQLEINKRNEARARGQKRGIATDRLEAEKAAIFKQIEQLVREIDEA